MFSKNLRFYRLKNGMSKKALAQACGISSMAVSNYESGKRKPGIEVIKTLASALGVKLSDLLERRNFDLRFVHGEFRKQSRMSVMAQEYIRESVEEYLGRFYDVVEALGGEVLPDPPASKCLNLSDDIEHDALFLRKHLQINPIGPVYNLTEILENRGIIVIYIEDADAQFSGMNGYVNERPYIAINCQMSPERIRSTIVHELAHLMFVWTLSITDIDEEQRATAISGAFLFPARDAQRELGIRRRSITYDMEAIAQDYGISMMLLAKRASQIGIIGLSTYREFCIAASKAGWRTKEPSRIDPEQSELLEQFVYRAVCENDISAQRGAELLNCSFEEIVDECKMIGS